MASILLSEGSDCAASVGAGEGKPWSYILPARGRSSRRRSRSSPVRCAVSSAPRARSPSASSRRHSPAINCSYPLQPECSCNQISDWSHVTAYFSEKPPKGPLRLVPIMASPVPVMSSRHESPHRQSDLAIFPMNFPEDNELSILDPPKIKQHVETKRKSSGHHRRRVVRRLLHDLVTSLPLSATVSPCPVTCQETNMSSTCLTAAKVSQAVAAASVSLMPTPRTSADCKHVAVQASGRIKCAEKYQDDGYIISGSKRLSTKDEWVGGVRALRDSHVRLVLRQLRHIKRLNRALDRAAPPFPVRTVKQ
ncbi:uncharacterized protein LOC128201050 [Galleria mellonella]|uniref:Uncharacterized protein LOC128201050 n=1 Tax=Galleria mellonella TaxID=7137 RepID=A0ABM3MN26_GALME|nr:uncharacterized protein LOC128201050 [Galleria mellonella]